MALRRFVVPVTVDGDGDAEVFSPVLSGKLISFRYVKDDFTDGVDFTVTAEASGETLWAEENVNASATRYPRGALHSTAGAASLYAALGEAVNGKITLSQDRVKFVVAAGGDETSGTFHITIDG
ncbi:hypothetical protein JP75_07985 [Devosia riboflavina]|uniref:Uncharacterized protein n=1 Tax=Devosia riboflavina TaxID=46914 RepID=A0A087M3M2_9HYPH|nr:hypothetical protein [Devosia riboflavina]KFL31475.1 hypothetical protein JP75_07985 [Devosia riboflavina]